MVDIELLEEIFKKSNEQIFKLDPLPWTDEKVVFKNISTFTKRRISVKGVRKLLKKDATFDAVSYDRLVEHHLIAEITNSEIYVVITEYGILYLNVILSGLANDHYTAVKVSREYFVKCAADITKRKCEAVFSIDISPQEAVLSLFLLLNGTNSYGSAFQLHVNPKGEYLHGVTIINEINSLFIELTGDDQETLIKDEKEFRNVIGRNGKNGRLAKAFPDIYQREDGKIWFDIEGYQTKESDLISLRSMITEIMKVLSKDYSYGLVCTRLVKIVEKYMINNPIEPYILKDVFSGLNKFDHLINLHIVTKDIELSTEEPK
ncbi:hypothetical protein [Paenibacillus massiliensis]|uniref:hypothetical protein n=1 Tax=Paenibacillus massiliensis TaxID=225917 RepID=UPI0004154B30|nr:hypothetical protein [Paenibacillus massiliensis]